MMKFKTWLDDYFETLTESDAFYKEVSIALSEQPSAYTLPFNKNVWIEQIDKLFLKCNWLVNPYASKNIGNEKLVMWMNGDKMAWFITDDKQAKWLFYVEQSTKDHQILRSMKNGSSISYYDFLKNIVQVSGNEIKSGEPITPAAISTWKKILSNKQSKFEIFDSKTKSYTNDVPSNLFSSSRFTIFVSEIG